MGNRSKMRVGEVVQIRVNPRDCITVVDILEKIGMSPSEHKEMSFPAAVSLALTVALEHLRTSGNVPDRDGFEFMEKMAPFALKQRSGSKLQFTERLAQVDSDSRAKPITPIQHSQPDVPYSLQRLFNRCDELEGKKNADPLNWSSQEEAQLQEAIQAVVAERCRLAGEAYIAP